MELDHVAFWNSRSPFFDHGRPHTIFVNDGLFSVHHKRPASKPWKIIFNEILTGLYQFKSLHVHQKLKTCFGSVINIVTPTSCRCQRIKAQVPKTVSKPVKMHPSDKSAALSFLTLVHTGGAHHNAPRRGMASNRTAPRRNHGQFEQGFTTLSNFLDAYSETCSSFWNNHVLNSTGTLSNFITKTKCQS